MARKASKPPGRPATPRLYQTVPKDREARAAAVEAFAQVLPEIPAEDVAREVAQAIAYTAREHGRWFWRR